MVTVTNVRVTPAVHGANITWDTDDYTIAEVIVSTIPGGPAIVTRSEDVRTGAGQIAGHTATIYNLSPDTTYYFVIDGYATPTSATFKSSTMNFTTLPLTDIVPSDWIETIDIRPGSTMARLVVKTTLKTIITVIYSADAVILDHRVEDNVFRNLHYITIRDLTPGAKYYFRIAITDEQGNTVTSSTSKFQTAGTVTPSACGATTAVIIALGGVIMLLLLNII